MDLSVSVQQLTVLVDLLRSTEVTMCQLQPINQIQVALTLETYLHGGLGHLVVIQPQMQMRQVATTPYFPG